MQYIGRPSLSQNNSLQNISRRSSISGMRKTKVKIDYRKDRDSNIKILGEFLTRQKFPDEVSPRTLRSPATNYVKNIFLFLINKISPTVTEFEKFDVDVKSYLEARGYPVSFSKTYLQAPGTPNSWPCILSSIVWLIEVYEFKTRLDLDTEDPSLELLKGCSLTADQYNNFLAGSDMEEVKEKMMQFYQEKSEKLREAIDEKNYQIESLHVEIDEISREPRVEDKMQEFKSAQDRLNDSKQKNASLSSDLKETISDNERYKKLEKRLEEKLEAIKIQEEFAKKTIEAQKITREDVNKMKSESKLLKKEFEYLDKKIKEKTKRLEVMEEKSKKHRLRLDSAAGRLNESLVKIQVVPADAKFAYATDYSLKVNHEKGVLLNQDLDVNLRRITSVDLKTKLKRHLRQILRLLTEETGTLQTEIAQLRSVLDEHRAELTREEKEQGGEERELRNLKDLHIAKSLKHEEEQKKDKEELFSKKLTAFCKPEGSTTLFKLVEKYNKIIKTEKEVKAKNERQLEEKQRGIIEAIEKFTSYRKLRVEEFRQLEKLTNKLNLIYPRPHK